MAKKQQKNENFDTVVAQATITATSNKSDGKYKQKKPTKTIYLVPATEEDSKKLSDFGLQLYTPDKEKDPESKPHFVVKATENVKIFTSETEFEEVNFGVSYEDVNQETGEITVKKTPNYKTEIPVHVAIMFVEGGDNGNDFFRLNALMMEDTATLEEVQPVNPFAVLFAK
jgi:orf7 protein|nr:MAG TPA: hypothetical protein [Caudoviricetes sp.]